MQSSLKILSEHACFGGAQRFYEHDSNVIGLPMRQSFSLPQQAEHGVVPSLFYVA